MILGAPEEARWAQPLHAEPADTRRLVPPRRWLAQRRLRLKPRPGRVEGMPTAFSIGPMGAKLRLGEEDVVVWEESKKKVGRVRGWVIEPLYPTVPLAAAEDPLLHEYLALVDTLRIGPARERAMARDELAKRLAA